MQACAGGGGTLTLFENLVDSFFSSCWISLKRSCRGVDGRQACTAAWWPAHAVDQHMHPILLGAGRQKGGDMPLHACLHPRRLSHHS
eukprot:362265-Chlamydomonas_euryale.AAC.16